MNPTDDSPAKPTMPSMSPQRRAKLQLLAFGLPCLALLLLVAWYQDLNSFLLMTEFEEKQFWQVTTVTGVLVAAIEIMLFRRLYPETSVKPNDETES